jgi:5-methylcytosine-specific restriction endonuclease McrA
MTPRERRPRQVGVRRIEDPHHPPGYRELRSNAEMRKLMNQKIALQHGKCALCGEKFTDYNDVVPDHISPRGMDGAWRDDHPDNIQAVHWWCNGEKGSSRV